MVSCAVYAQLCVHPAWQFVMCTSCIKIVRLYTGYLVTCCLLMVCGTLRVHPAFPESGQPHLQLAQADLDDSGQLFRGRIELPFKQQCHILPCRLVQCLYSVDVIFLDKNFLKTSHHQSVAELDGTFLGTLTADFKYVVIQ